MLDSCGGVEPFFLEDVLQVQTDIPSPPWFVLETTYTVRLSPITAHFSPMAEDARPPVGVVESRDR
jgi:hypothetical protein